MLGVTDCAQKYLNGGFYFAFGELNSYKYRTAFRKHFLYFAIITIDARAFEFWCQLDARSQSLSAVFSFLSFPTNALQWQLEQLIIILTSHLSGSCFTSLLSNFSFAFSWSTTSRASLAEAEVHHPFTVVDKVRPGERMLEKSWILKGNLPCEVIFLGQPRVNQELASKHCSCVPATNFTVVVSQLHLLPVQALRLQQPEVLEGCVQLTEAPIEGEEGGSRQVGQGVEGSRQGTQGSGGSPGVWP